ncbi:amidohydrolase [Pseudoxanthomonas taiwanensis]|uniref:Amidohydrolase n=1 Tax=Pseudoxanthomonas taiwanensis TaxID=176598 RepID=A0A921NSQ2_9GAMM|nr:amidohydrolase [Pseudoxanthomonas taiwanensis]KAF1688811.1 amidohydrolase [Pseudoxanthomonas taiwanensis]
MSRTALATALLCLLALPAHAAGTPAADAARVRAAVEAWAPRQAALAQAIWERPELGYQETTASALLQAALREAGFSVEAGVAGIPTAFVARAGRRGKGPVIALLAEMDALPGMSQQAVPQRLPFEGQDAGHACGHNLFGAGVVGAARAIAQWLRESGRDGEVRVYGTPAEEGGSGKVYMVRAGLFDDVDVALHWHPADANSAVQSTSLANLSGKFRFRGVAAHAAISPERGRSALDGVEAFNHMANLMREHVPDGTRIHYAITDGGRAPNVVPAYAEVYYYVRHPDGNVVREVFERLHDAARGAALGTGTQVEFEPLGGVHALLPNDTLGRVLDRALRQVGGVAYDASERGFATQLQATLERRPPLEAALEVAPYRADERGLASTDVGDVSQVVPTAGIATATWVPGTPAHSWQAVAASGMSIGHRGTLNAAAALALAAVELYSDPELVRAARREFEQRRGGAPYRPLLQRERPPLDYRTSPSP